MFGATKLYPYFVDIFGFHGTFWLYGLVMVVEVVYGAISLPENKGQSLVKTEDKMIRDKADVGEGSSLIIWIKYSGRIPVEWSCIVLRYGKNSHQVVKLSN